MPSLVSFPGGDPRLKLAKVQRAVYQGCIEAAEDAGNFCAARARRNLQDAGRVDNGELLGSIESSVVGHSDRVTATVVVGKSYGRWVEFGRLGKIDSPPGTDPAKSARAAWPPVSVIKDWVHRHFKQFAPLGRTKSGRARRGNPARLDAAEDSLAYLVGRKIALHGIKPTPFLLPAYEAVRKLFPRLLARAVQRNLGKIK